MRLPFERRTRFNKTPLAQLLSTPGLVACYLPYRDVVGRNLLPVGSEDFQTGWAASSGASLTLTGNQADPDGGTNAYRIQTTGGTSVVKYLMPSGGNHSASNAIGGIWYKVNSGKVRFGLAAWHTGFLTDADWTFVSFTGSSNVRFYIGVESASDNLDVTVYHPQANLGQLYPYSPPVGQSQSLIDYSPQGNHAQLGSTAGADTNDPKWSHVSLYFDGVDDSIANEPTADYALYAWGATNSAFGWVSSIPVTTGYWFGGIRMNRTPGASEEARLKANIATLLAGQGVSVA